MKSDWLTALLTIPTQTFTNRPLRFLNLHHHAKNQIDSSIFPEDITDLRILQSHWLIPYWLITEEPKFPQIWNLCRHKANNVKFNTNQEKSKEKKILEILKKP